MSANMFTTVRKILTQFGDSHPDGCDPFQLIMFSTEWLKSANVYSERAVVNHVIFACMKFLCIS